MKRSLMVGMLIFGSMSSLAAASAAAEPSPDVTLSPYFFVENGDPAVDRLPLKETRVRAQIAGVIADVVVTQVYRNEGSRPIHARYVFPASTRAAVHGMTMQIGEQRIRARIREKEQARQEFEAAKEAGKSAALLEEQRPNVFSMSVANVLPQDEIEVELHYSELLVPTDGIYELVYPTVVGPRYSKEPEGKAGAGAGWVKSPYLQKGAPAASFDIEARLAAGMPIAEVLVPSHRTSVDWEGADTAVVKLDPREKSGANRGGGDRDFVLRYRLAGDEIQSGLLLYPQKDKGYFLLMVQPPRRVAPAAIPPREYIFVLDVSGSMEGFPLDTAKALMRDLVGGLRPVDRFNIILFAGGSRVLAPQSLPASPENVAQAIEEIEGEQGGGGTELGEALARALALPGNEGVSRTTIVVTDGYIDAEPQVFESVRKNLGSSNLFAFGIGSSVNRHLIEGLARAGQGEPFVVLEPSETRETAARFAKYVSAPVLTDIDVATEGFGALDMVPDYTNPDVFADRPLVIFGTYRGAPTGKIRIEGVGGEGVYREEFDVAEAAASADNRALSYLWARARVATLIEQDLGGNDKIREQIVSIGLEYELLTPYTSFVAVHEVVRKASDSAVPVDQPLPLPAGVSEAAVGDAVPEPELALLLALGLLLFFARFCWERRHPCRL